MDLMSTATNPSTSMDYSTNEAFVMKSFQTERQPQVVSEIQLENA
jgi:hypothetical protein